MLVVKVKAFKWINPAAKSARIAIPQSGKMPVWVRRMLRPSRFSRVTCPLVAAGARGLRCKTGPVLRDFSRIFSNWFDGHRESSRRGAGAAEGETANNR
jgi:hypothetical protein